MEVQYDVPEVDGEHIRQKLGLQGAWCEKNPLEF